MESRPQRRGATGPRPCSPDDISVLVAVKNPRVREAFAAIISAQEGFCVIAETGDDLAALESARLHRPVLALVDEDLPQSGGDWTCELLLREGTVQAVVALGARGDLIARSWALLAGASSYLQTNAPPCDIFAALAQALPPAMPGRAAIRQRLRRSTEALISASSRPARAAFAPAAATLSEVAAAC